MIAGTALVLAAILAAVTGPLEPAQEAFARGEYGRAETLALAAARPPQAGAALYLAGLARFREGRPGPALEAFEEAARAADPPEPAPLHYNKGACLYELGRYGEAEAEYLAAADLDPSLAAVSLVNAGFAALDGGSPERAKALAARARAAASEAAIGLVAELEAKLLGPGGQSASAEYREGLSAYDTGRFAEARERFRRASELDPSDGRSWIMSGASAIRLGARGEARSDLETALRLPLDPADARVARDYLDELSRGLSARARGWEGTVLLGAGFDNDSLPTGFLGLNEFPGTSTGSTPSAIALTGAALDWRFRPREDLVGGFAYGFDQLAYLSSAASDRSLQQHLLSGRLELSIRDDLRIGASVGGQLAFTGLSGFRGLQAGGGAGAWVALDEGELTTSRLDLEWAHKVGLSAGFGYLTGDRADAALSQELRLGPLTLVLGDRLRAELIGTSRQPAPFPPPPGQCPPPGSCTQEVVDPFRYAGNTVWLSARAEPLSRLALELSGGFEQRNYLADNSILLQLDDGSSSVTSARRRHDRRWFAGASAGLRLSRALSLFLRYDLVVNRSNLGSSPPSGPGPGPPAACGPTGFGCDDRSYDKHVLTLETAFSF